MFALFCICVVVASSQRAYAYQATSATQPSSDNSSLTLTNTGVSNSPEFSVKIGLGGRWKLGNSTRLQVTATSQVDSVGRCALQVVDGDGVPVLYMHPRPIVLKASEPALFELLFRAGRSDAEAKLLWWNETDTATRNAPSEYKFFPADLAQPFPSQQPWIVEVGDLNLGVESLYELREQLPPYSTSKISKAEELPDETAAYSGVDVVAISTADMQLLNEITMTKRNALLGFVRDGGRVLISLGKNAVEAAKLDWVRELLPGPVLGVANNINASAIEQLLGNKASTRLDNLTMPFLQLQQGTSDLTITTPNRQRIYVITRNSYGLGRVSTFTADINEPPLAKWEDRPALIQRVLQGEWVAQDEITTKTTGATSSYLGYNDLTGQLRATLDTFPEVRMISFSFLAVLLIAFLLLIGPAEYYFWIRGLQRSGWTWPTLMLVVSLCSLGIVALYHSWRPALPLVKGVEMVDIDNTTGYQRGRLWYHTYSSSPTQIDITSAITPLGNAQLERTYADWQPLPGKGMGGLESGIRNIESLPPYQADAPPIVGDKSTAMAASGMHAVPFAAGATKSLRLDWSAQGKPFDIGNLSEIPGSVLLQGEVRNPLDVELLDSVLLYRNLVYTLPANFKPGASEKLSILSTPNDLERRLTRRVAIDGKDITKPWDPGERDELPQLMEMLFFYKAAGGEKYTGLQHRFQPSLDLSDALNLDRAILLGRLGKHITELEVSTPQGKSAYRPEGNSYVRWLIPITRGN